MKKKKELRYKKIYDLVVEVVEPSIRIIKRTRKRRTMPFVEIEKILGIFFPRTKHYQTGKGFYKHVFVIHSDKKKLALKIGRNKRDIRRDFAIYDNLPENIRNRYFAKIYWRHNIFILQKFGKSAAVPDRVERELKIIGTKFGLKDIRKANIMKFGNRFKIVDATKK